MSQNSENQGSNAVTFDPNTTVVVATGNAHKLVEIEAILSKVMPGISFVALGQLGDFPDPEENGQTFRDNALIKAMAALDEVDCVAAIADDSGICVDALDELLESILLVMLASMAMMLQTIRSFWQSLPTLPMRTALLASTPPLLWSTETDLCW